MSDKLKKLMSSGKSRIDKGKKKKKEDAGTPDSTGVHADADIGGNTGINEDALSDKSADSDEYAGSPQETGGHLDSIGHVDAVVPEGAAYEGDSAAGDVNVGTSVPPNEPATSNQIASSDGPVQSNQPASSDEPATFNQPAPTIQPALTVQATPTVQAGLTGQFESPHDPSPSADPSLSMTPFAANAVVPAPLLSSNTPPTVEAPALTIETPALTEKPAPVEKPTIAAGSALADTTHHEQLSHETSEPLKTSESLKVPQTPITQKDKAEFVVYDVSSQMRESLNIVLQSNLSAEVLQTLASMSAEDRQTLLSLQCLGPGGISELCKIARDDEYVMTSKIKLISLLNLISKKEFVKKMLQKAGAIVQAIARLRELLSL